MPFSLISNNIIIAIVVSNGNENSMTYLLSQKPLKDLLRDYDFSKVVEDTDFAKMERHISKSKLVGNIEIYISLYILYKKDPLYISVMSDNAFNSLFKNSSLVDSYRFSRFVGIPRFLSFKLDEDEFQKVPDEEAIMTVDEINEILSKISSWNFNESPLCEICISSEQAATATAANAENAKSDSNDDTEFYNNYDYYGNYDS